MRSFTSIFLFTALVLSTAVVAQRATITLPWANGDTIVVSTGTDADGDPITRTLSTVTSGVAGAITTPTTTPTTTRTRTTTRDGANEQTLGRQTDTAIDPMRTTTYGYDPGNGVWTSAVWTASIQEEPTVATFNVPEGTMVAYTDYQSIMNNAVVSSVDAASGASPIAWTGIAGWSAMFAGALGAGVALARL